MIEPKKPHLSPSQLTMLSRCPKQFEFRYVEGLRIPPGVAQIVGTASHRSVEKNLKSKIDTGLLLPDEEVEQIAADALVAEWAGQEPKLDDEEKEQGVDKTLGDAKDQAVQLARVHHKELAPSLKPTHVERFFRLELKGFPYDMIGYIDVQEGSDAVRDTKTTGKSPSQQDADGSIQLTTYGLAVKASDGKAPAKYTLDGLVKGRKGGVSLAIAETQRTEGDFRSLLHRVELAAKIIERGAFYPTDPTNWWCSARWCGYWDRCEFGGRHRVQTGFEV